MKKYIALIITALILLPCIAISQETPAASSAPEAAAQTLGKTDDSSIFEAETQQNTLEILRPIVKSKSTLKQRMDEKKQAVDKASSETERQYLNEELAALDKQIADAVTDFELRIPITELIGKTSRRCDTHESWFPCRKNDWVILSDGTRGGVTHLSHETVELVLRGGAKKTYQTADFLAMTPLNLSVNFRIKVPFGIGYGHQKDATTTIPELLSAFIQEQIEKEGYADDLLNLRVEFAQAGASSLDLVVITDFKGSQAPVYNRLTRSIQRWCVDAASQYNWDIPFPQITVHLPGDSVMS
ncbi:MAG: hypothetical protein KBE30_03145 [Desulfobacter sp.]|nr:hypothetical protein [Desulfobacter sp.]